MPAKNFLFRHSSAARRAGILAFAVLSVLLAVSAAVRGDPPSLAAVKVDHGPKLDGDLQDPVWGQATPFSAFKMVFPIPGAEPTERTELRVLVDGANLYLGVRCFDSQPKKISANSMAHDGGGEEQEKAEDVVRVLLDPFQNKRTAYVFIVNARGARSEGLASGEYA